jgi:hypothetical protein
LFNRKLRRGEDQFQLDHIVLCTLQHLLFKTYLLFLHHFMHYQIRKWTKTTLHSIQNVYRHRQQKKQDTLLFVGENTIG